MLGADTSVCGEPIELIPIKHEEAWLLDQLPGMGCFQLTNIITDEIRVLPVCHGGWILEFDEDGNGVCASVVDDVEECQVVDLNCFQTQLFRDADTEEVFVQKPGENPQSLQTMRCRYTNAVCHVSPGTSAAKYDVNCCVFHIARPCNQRVWWDVQCLYTNFGLQSYGGVPSNWVAKRHKAWSRLFVSVLGCDQPIHSSHGNKVGDPRNWEWHCTPTTCVSTAGLLLLLQRFALATTEMGGFSPTERDPQKGAKELLMRLLEPVMDAGQPLVLKLDLVDDWCSPWPRPTVSYIAQVAVVLERGGVIDWMPLKLAAEGAYMREERATPAMRWWNWLSTSSVVDHAFKCGLGEFLAASASSRNCISLVGQVACQVAVALEKLCGRATQNIAFVDLTSHLKFQWLDSCLAYDENLEAAVAAYQARCVEACFQHEQVFISTDKATVNGLPLQFSLISIPDNTMMVSVPQANRMQIMSFDSRDS